MTNTFHSSRRLLSWFTMSIFILLISACSSESSEPEIIKDPDPEPKKEEGFSWKTSPSFEIEQNLKKACSKEEGDVSSIVSQLKTNKNVEQAFTSNDNLSVIVKYKDDNCYSVYPIHKLEDPFVDGNSNSRSQVVGTRSDTNYKKTGSRGVVAVFNYFSNLHNRKLQNETLEYMMHDLNDHDYGVEYYPYEDMNVKNLRNVVNNSKDYTAVIIMSHGFSEGKTSYFAIGEEYNDLSWNDDVYKWIEKDHKGPKEKDSFIFRIWNEGIGAFNNDRYDCVIPVNNMKLNENTILYMGACDGMKNPSLEGTYIGWDGPNCMAQAHVAVLFYKLMRGKTLLDALDIKDEQNPYFQITAFETDTWTTDPVYPSTNMKCQMRGRYNPGSIDGGVYDVAASPYFFVPAVDYYKSAHICLKCAAIDGVYRQGDAKDIEISSFCLWSQQQLSPDAMPDKIYVKATPLRNGAKEIVVSLKRKKNKLSFEKLSLHLSYNGAYSLTASVDKDFTKEIKLRKPIIFLYSKNFSENGLVFEDDDEDNIEIFTVNGVSFNMVKVDGGSFMMGSPDDDPDAGGIYSDETPQHKVTLDSYYIGETEVTQELWKTVMGSNPSIFQGENLPVEEISWDDSQVFIKKLNALTGEKFRLPTEAEWEYAARGGQKSKGYKYAGSDDVDEVAWNCNNSNNRTHTVGTKGPNELGLYDMSGNVWEWCQDWYGFSYYKESPVINPCNTTEASSNRPEDHQHIHRGGSIEYVIKDLRVAMRGDYYNSPSNRLRGLRIVLANK